MHAFRIPYRKQWLLPIVFLAMAFPGKQSRPGYSLPCLMAVLEVVLASNHEGYVYHV